MTALKVVRNLVGTASMLFAAYIFFSSVKDAARYMKISSM